MKRPIPPKCGPCATPENYHFCLACTSMGNIVLSQNDHTKHSLNQTHLVTRDPIPTAPKPQYIPLKITSLV